MANKYDKYNREKLVLWTPTSTADDPYRESGFADGTEIDGRWFEGRHETVDSEGNSITAEHSAFVDRDIEIGAYLYRGAIDEVDETKNPRDVEGAHRVVNFASVDDMAMQNRFRTVSMV